MAPPLVTAVLAKAGANGRKELGHRVSWAMVIEVLQLVSSMLVFFALTRLLSTDSFGIMGGVLAVAAPAASLSSIGSHALLVRQVAQGGDLTHAWHRALSMGVLGPALGSLALIGLKPVILPGVSFWVYTLLIIAQINFFWISELAIFVGNGTRRLKEAAKIRAVVVALRLGALGLFALVGHGSLTWWAVASFVSFGLGALVAVLHVWWAFGPRPSFGRVTGQDIRDGFPFAVNSVSESVVDLSDRPLLVRYNHDVDAAVYTVAARIIQFGYLPLIVLLRASDADMFEAGRHGTRTTLAVVRRLLAPSLGVSALVGLGFLALAPLIPLVAGSEYHDAIPAIRYLAVVPLIRSVQYLMGNCLSASGRQWWRVGATMAAGLLNFGLNVRFLPAGTWRTASYTTIASELFLAAVMTAMVLARSGWEARQQWRPPA